MVQFYTHSLRPTAQHSALAAAVQLLATHPNIYDQLALFSDPDLSEGLSPIQRVLKDLLIDLVGSEVPKDWDQFTRLYTDNYHATTPSVQDAYNNLLNLMMLGSVLLIEHQHYGPALLNPEEYILGPIEVSEQSGFHVTQGPSIASAIVQKHIERDGSATLSSPLIKQEHTQFSFDLNNVEGPLSLPHEIIIEQEDGQPSSFVLQGVTATRSNGSTLMLRRYGDVWWQDDGNYADIQRTQEQLRDLKLQPCTAIYNRASVVNDKEVAASSPLSFKKAPLVNSLDLVRLKKQYKSEFRLAPLKSSVPLLYASGGGSTVSSVALPVELRQYSYHDRLDEMRSDIINDKVIDSEFQDRPQEAFARSMNITNQEGVQQSYYVVDVAGDNNCGLSSIMWAMIDLLQQGQLNLKDIRYQGLVQDIIDYTYDDGRPAFASVDELVTWLNSLDPAKAEHRFVLRMAIAPALRHYLVDKIINPYLASEEPQGIMLRDLANFYNRGDTNMTTPRVLGLTSPYTALLEHVKAEGSLEAARELLLRELALNGEAMRREQSELMRTRQEQLDQDFLIGLSQNLGLKLHLINGTVNMSHGTAGPVIISEEVEEGLPVYLHGDSGHFKVLLSTPHRTQKNEEDIFKSKGFVSSTLRHLGNLSPTSVPNYKFSPRKSGW